MAFGGILWPQWEVGVVGVMVIGTAGVGTGWARTPTLYPLLAIMVLFLSHLPWVLGFFKSWHWCLVGLVMTGFVEDGFAAAGFGVGAWALDQVCLLTLNMLSSLE